MGKARVGFPAAAQIPAGFIGLWSGAVAAIPKGWALCDGTNGTPDLRDRFVAGAGGGYAVGARGGFQTVALTLAQIPSHNHSVNSKSGRGYLVDMSVYNESNTNSTGTSGQFSTTYAGGGQAHENRPPFHALCYIMKL